MRGNSGFGWGGRLQAIFLFLGGVFLAIGVLYNIQPLLGIFIPLDIIALVIFLVRLGRPVIGARWLEADSSRHYAIGVPWIAVARPVRLASASPSPTGCQRPGSIATRAPPGRSSRAASVKAGATGPW